MAVSPIQASIVYSGANRNVVYEKYSFVDTFSLFDEAAQWDDISLDAHVFEDLPHHADYTFGNLLQVHGNYVDFVTGVDFFEIKNFSLGQTIDGASTFAGNNYKDFSSSMNGSDSGEFLNTTGYAGFRLINGVDTYYGWIRVSVANYNNSNLEGTLIDWAYENTPGLAITAGTIPEPSSLALGAFGLLTLVGMTRRSRNR